MASSPSGSPTLYTSQASSARRSAGHIANVPSRGHAHHPPCKVQRVAAAVEHARELDNASGLLLRTDLQCRDLIVARPACQARRAPPASSSPTSPAWRFVVTRFRRQITPSGEIERAPGVVGSLRHQLFNALPRYPACRTNLFVFQGALQHHVDVVRRQRLSTYMRGHDSNAGIVVPNDDFRGRAEKVSVPSST